MHIILDMFNTYENVLTKALQVEMDEDYSMHPVDNRIEEQLERTQKSLRGINLKGHDT